MNARGCRCGFGGTEGVSAGERVRDGRALDGGELLTCVRESSLRRLREVCP